MPAKTVVCCICNQEVSKRSTLSIGEGRACREHAEVKACIEDNMNAIRRMKAEWPLMKEKLVLTFQVECAKRFWRNIVTTTSLTEWANDYPVKEFVGRMFKELELTSRQVDEVMEEVKELKRRNEWSLSLPELMLAEVRLAFSPSQAIGEL